jgi:hypothetical protein
MMVLWMELMVFFKHQQHIVTKLDHMDNVLIFLNWNIEQKKIHYYNNNIEWKLTPIEPIIKVIRINKSQSFIIIMIQFPI